MKRKHPSLYMIEVVVKALGDLTEEVVFVGGSTVPLYLDDEGSPDPRPTDDVDCVVEVYSYPDFGNFEQKLRERGFSHSMKPKDPICRWQVNGVTVDVMPTDSSILGFSNKWYTEGVASAMQVTLPSGAKIKIFTPPYFIASKFEAFSDRGHNDFRTSPDFEDVVSLLDGLLSFDSIIRAPHTVKAYLKEKLSTFFEQDTFLESISAHLEPGLTNADRTRRVITLFKEITSS